MKTIRELSNSIGVSRVSLYSMIKHKEFKPHLFKGANNTTLIDDVGEQLLKAYYLKEQCETLQDIVAETIGYEEDSKADSKDNDHVKSLDIISILQAQLSEKDSQISALLNIVANGQKLQVTKLLVDKSNQPVADVFSQHSDIEQSKTNKKSWWARFFTKVSL